MVLSLSLHLAVIGLIRLVPIQPGEATVVIETWLSPMPTSNGPVLSSATDEMQALPEPGHDKPRGVPQENVQEAVPAAQDTAKQEIVAASTPVLTLPAIADLRWYGAREVDNLPTAKSKIEPKYPEVARRNGQTGSVKLRLRIDETGKVEELEVIESSPQGVFDAAATAAFENAKFEPARKAGRPVRYEGFFKVAFELD